MRPQTKDELFGILGNLEADTSLKPARRTKMGQALIDDFKVRMGDNVFDESFQPPSPPPTLLGKPAVGGVAKFMETARQPFGDVEQKIEEAPEGFTARAVERVGEVKEFAGQEEKGEISKGRQVFKTAAKGAGQVADTVFSGIGKVLGLALPSGFEEKGKEIVESETFQQGLRWIGGQVDKGAEITADALYKVPAIKKLADQFDAMSPEDKQLVKEDFIAAKEMMDGIVAVLMVAEAAPAVVRTAVRATEGAIATSGEVISSLGGRITAGAQATKNFGGKVSGFVLPVTEKEAAMAQRAAAGLGKEPRTAGQTASERGMLGTETMVGKQATQEANRIFTKEINPALEAIPEGLSKDTLFKKLDDIVAKEIGPGRKTVLQDGLNALKEDYLGVSELSFPEWQKIKSGLDKFLPQKLFKGKDVASGYNQMRFEFANAIRGETYGRLSDIAIRNKYLDYGNLLELQKVGINARKGTVIRPGGSQTFLKSIWDKAAVPIGTSGGRIIYKVGEGLEFVGEKGLKTLGEYLKSVGVEKATFERVFLVPESVSIGEQRMPKFSAGEKTGIGRLEKEGFSKGATPTKLLEEAKKFKSAEEFVKGQPKVFHGTTRDFEIFDASKLGEASGSKSGQAGFWFTDDVSTAKSYSKAENEKIVGELLKQGKKQEAVKLENKIFADKDPRFLKEISLDLKNPKIIDAKGKRYNELDEVLVGDDAIQDIITKAKAEGRDGLIIKNLSDHADYSVYKPATHYLVFNPANIKTKSQLTEIWNKANK